MAQPKIDNKWFPTKKLWIPYNTLILVTDGKSIALGKMTVQFGDMFFEVIGVDTYENNTITEHQITHWMMCPAIPPCGRR